MVRTSGMKQAIRVLEHATRVVTRAASNSTSANNHTGRWARELEGYVTRLKRFEKQGRAEEFYKALQNAQMKLVRLVSKMIR